MSDDDLQRAKAFFLQGLQALEHANWPAAEQLFEQALALAPGRISVMQNLGITRVRLQRHAQAEPLLRAVVAQEPQQLEVWETLAEAQMALGQIEAAAHSYAQCLALGANSATLHGQHAQCLARLGRVTEAEQAYRQALQLAPGNTQALTELGGLYREAGRYAEAADCFRQALAHGGDRTLLEYFLAAVTAQADVAAPPRQYVQTLFDQYADEFDTHLVSQLGYRGHQRLIDLLPPEAAGPQARVLDLGCGTGLCGAQVRARAQYLVGVDLSPAMVEKARARAVYDALHVADIHDFLATPQDAYDLVLAADVFIYVGPLEQAFGLLTTRLRPGGWLAFTVEDAPADQTVQLLPSLRYAHSPTYLQDLARRHGFKVMASHEDAIRYDQQRPVPGRYVYLRRG